MNIRFIDSKNILNLLFTCFEWPFWKEFLFFYEYTVEIPTLEYRVDWKILDIYLRSINAIKLYYIYSSRLKTLTVDLKMFNHFTARNIEIKLMIINLMTCKDYAKFRYDYVKNHIFKISINLCDICKYWLKYVCQYNYIDTFIRFFLCIDTDTTDTYRYKVSILSDVSPITTTGQTNPFFDPLVDKKSWATREKNLFFSCENCTIYYFLI